MEPSVEMEWLEREKDTWFVLQLSRVKNIWLVQNKTVLIFIDPLKQNIYQERERYACVKTKYLPEEVIETQWPLYQAAIHVSRSARCDINSAHDTRPVSK